MATRQTNIRKAKKRKRTKLDRATILRRERQRKTLQRAYRRIMEVDGVSMSTAKRRYRNAVIEIGMRRPSRSPRLNFIRLPGSEKIFKRIKVGKPIKFKNVTGPVLSWKTVQKKLAQQKYWDGIYILSEVYGMSLSEARSYIKRKKADSREDGNERTALSILQEELGDYYA